MAMSKDFLESVLPKPELSGDDEDFPDMLGECLSSCFGGTSFRMFITLSTILAPIKTGLTLSLALICTLLTAGTELPLLRTVTFVTGLLEGEHDCRLGRAGGPGSTEEDRAAGAPGLPLEAERGLSGADVLKFGGASSEKPAISEGFQALDLTVGQAPRAGMGFFVAVDVEAGLVTEDGRRVGVADLELVAVGLDAGIEGLAVGVEDLAVALEVGVEDLAEAVGLVVGTVGLVAGLVAGTVVLVGAVALVGVAGLDGLDPDVTVGLLVGVAGLDPGPPDDKGLRVTPLEEFNPGDKTGCLDTELPLAAGSGSGFANWSHR
ncbi:hypothetical protein RJ641_035919 [Dillenia turbinata]|uniref:Uncharacterized protein n=1 Tax=Dillenia turbinata TaxID=194707 RepID=A0AAN8VEZ8_9MAGN